jgi:serine/threonine protein kinase
MPNSQKVKGTQIQGSLSPQQHQTDTMVGEPAIKRESPSAKDKEAEEAIKNLLNYKLHASDPEFHIISKRRELIEKIFSASELSSSAVDLGGGLIVEMEEAGDLSNVDIRVIGKGAMGEVHLVEDIPTGQKLIFKKALLVHESSKKRLLREAHIMHKLKEHNPSLSVVDLKKAGPKGIPGIPDSAGEYFLVSEYVEGSDMSQAMDSYKHTIAYLESSLRNKKPIAKKVIVQLLQQNVFFQFAGESLDRMMNLRLIKSPGRQFSHLEPDDIVSEYEVHNIIRVLEKIKQKALAKLASQLLKGLSEIHAQGMLHRDIKPANIMLQPGGVLKIIDFGLAKEEGSGDIGTGSGLLESHYADVSNEAMPGTPQYFSPELARRFLESQFNQALLSETAKRNAMKGLVDAEASPNIPGRDLYATGLTIWFLLNGSMPFKTHLGVMNAMRSLGSKNKEFNLENVNPRIDPDLATIINKMLEKDVNKRYNSALEAQEAFSNYLQKAALKEQNKRSIHHLLEA